MKIKEVKKKPNDQHIWNKMKNIILYIFLIIIFSSFKANAQEIKEVSDSSKSNTLYTAIALTSVYYASSMLILSETWYKDRKIVPFHFYDDSKGYLQVDKLGHVFGAYFYSYVGYNCLLNIGLPQEEALLYGGSLGFILQLPIEIMDGVHEGWGFSWSDLLANASGSLFVIGQELLFKEQIVKYKFSYWESLYSHKANGYLGKNTFQKIFDDYNGHTYWLSMPISKIVTNSILPEWLNIAVGYSANGMYGEYENITSFNGVNIPETKRYRQFLFSLDIDWAKIKSDSKFLNTILQGLTFIKLPFPTIEYNSLGKFKLYWIYY